MARGAWGSGYGGAGVMFSARLGSALVFSACSAVIDERQAPSQDAQSSVFHYCGLLLSIPVDSATLYKDSRHPHCRSTCNLVSISRIPRLRRLPNLRAAAESHASGTFAMG